MSGATSVPCSAAVGSEPAPARARCRRGGVYAAIMLRFLVVALAVPPAGAQPSVLLSPEMAEPLTDVPLVLILNGEPRGDLFAKLSDREGVLLRLADFAVLDVEIIGGARARIGADEYVAIQSIPGARSSFDLNTLTVTLNLPAASFAAQRRELGSRRAHGVVSTQDDSEFMNYRLAVGGSDPGGTTLGLVNEIGARRGEWLFVSGSQFQDDDTGSGLRRFQTQLIRDERELARRWLIGDSFTQGGDLGSALNLGGVSLSKNYQLQPYFVYSPTASFEGSVAVPSDVEVFVGGTRVFRERLAPGSYSLSNFNHYGGRRDVRIVVRDAFGHEQEIESPYYFTDRVLAAGLQEYRYHAGLLRENYGQPGDTYGPLALSASHRYGVSDHLTVGGRGEYAEGRANLGPEVGLRSDTLGVASASLAYGRDPDRGSGFGAAAAYQFQYDAMNARVAFRGFSRGYGLADPLQNASHVTRELLAGAGYGTPALGSIHVQWLSREALGVPEMRVTQLNYSRTLLRRISLFASVQHESAAESSTGVSVGLTGWFGDENNASVFHNNADDAQSSIVQASNTIAPREGVGYRLSAEHGQQAESDYTRFSPYVELNRPRVTVIAESAVQSSGDTGDSSMWQLAAQGSVYRVGEHWGFGRRVDDGFALARVTPPLEDVRIYYSGREVGRTDARGEVLLPGIVSFLDNSIAIEDEDVPIDYTITQVERTISPPFRGGSLVEFRLGVQRNLVGYLTLKTPDGVRPLEYVEFALGEGDGALTAQTGAGGEFYVENLAPGAHPGRVRIGDRDCRFGLEVPERMAPIIEIEEPVTCEF